jgi:hypothetical protein
MIVAAWIIGWIVYMIAMMMTVYEGLLSFIFQPIIGAVASSIFVGAALLVGLVFRIPVIAKAWTSSRWWAALLAVGSILVLCLGSAVGLTAVYTTETGSSFTGLHPIAGLAASFLLIFSIANWPLNLQEQAP